MPWRYRPRRIYLRGGGGSGSASCSSSANNQRVSPSSRAFKSSEYCAAGTATNNGAPVSTPANTEALLVGLDGCRIVTNKDVSCASSTGAANGLGKASFAVSGNPDYIMASSFDVLNLLYFGLHNGTGGSAAGGYDCGSPQRRALASAWTNLFRTDCSSGDTVCSTGLIARLAPGRRLGDGGCFRRHPQPAGPRSRHHQHRAGRGSVAQDRAVLQLARREQRDGELPGRRRAGLVSAPRPTGAAATCRTRIRSASTATRTRRPPRLVTRLAVASRPVRTSLARSAWCSRSCRRMRAGIGLDGRLSRRELLDILRPGADHQVEPDSEPATPARTARRRRLGKCYSRSSRRPTRIRAASPPTRPSASA